VQAGLLSPCQTLTRDPFLFFSFSLIPFALSGEEMGSDFFGFLFLGLVVRTIARGYILVPKSLRDVTFRPPDAFFPPLPSSRYNIAVLIFPASFPLSERGQGSHPPPLRPVRLTPVPLPSRCSKSTTYSCPGRCTLLGFQARRAGLLLILSLPRPLPLKTQRLLSPGRPLADRRRRLAWSSSVPPRADELSPYLPAP